MKTMKNTSKTPRKFICCPSCGAKSKVLRTEFGGYQTRQCRSGHTFGYDKWIADRAFWGATTGRIPNPYSR